MKARRIEVDGGEGYIVVFDAHEDTASGLKQFARDQGLTAARITGVGAFESATFGYFDWDTKSYVDIPVNEQVEVLSFDGDIAVQDDTPQIHVHVVAGRRDGSTIGGHLMEGWVRPTMEVMIHEAPAELRRIHDEESGLHLIDPDVR